MTSYRFVNGPVVWPRLSRFDLGVVRLIGPGLGNLLFPWARARLLSAELGVPMVWPTWPQLKIGPLLRREPDPRFYSNLFVRSADYWGGIRKAWALSALPRVAEEAASRADHGLIVVDGMGNQFGSLVGQQALIRRELWKITRPTLQRAVGGGASPEIAVHVRLGDFSQSATAEHLMSRAQGYRIPLDWYERVIHSLRSNLESSAVHLYSDGTDQELRSLLAIRGVRRARQATALEDLLSMSSAGVLVGSSSTYSLWAAYLGGMPSVWYGEGSGPGLSRHGTSAEIGVTDGALHGSSFLSHANAALDQRRSGDAEPWYRRL